MLVKELIEELSKMDENTEVEILDGAGPKGLYRIHGIESGFTDAGYYLGQYKSLTTTPVVVIKI